MEYSPMPMFESERGQMGTANICCVKKCSSNGVKLKNGTHYLIKGIFCQTHYNHWKRYGHPLLDSGRLKNASKHYLYETYNGMKKRCYNENCVGYKNYGSRGISICERWLGKDGFSNFVADMGERPEGCSIDRINNDGNYEPSNCRWADKTTQNVNSSQTRWVVYKGERIQLVTLLRRKGLYPLKDNVRQRIDLLGWSVEDAVDKPIKKLKRKWPQKSLEEEDE